MLFTLLAFALALGVLITFHELGHYGVARLCGVRILRFSIGFGQVILRRTDKHGTEWALSAIPLGGYVKMQDEPPAGATPVQQAASFNHKPLWQRSLIVLAGPVANFILAALLYAALNVVGTQEPAAVIAPPAPASVAAQAGLRGNEQLVAVDGRAVHSWGQLRWALLDVLTSGGEAVLTAETENGRRSEHHLQIRPSDAKADSGDLLADAGLALAPPRALVSQVMEGGAGEAAGLRAGDLITQVGDMEQPTPQMLIKEISDHPGESLVITVLRDHATISLRIVPHAQTTSDGHDIGRIGVMITGDFATTRVRYGLVESGWRGAQRTVETAWLSLKIMGRMITGEVSPRHISGPVTIADYAGQTARAGLAAYVSFVALISVSIGVLNLLPIPMLDGGHLMYYVFEAVRGRPVPDEWIERGQRLGLMLLAALMGLAFFNDFVRLFT